MENKLYLEPFTLHEKRFIFRQVQSVEGGNSSNENKESTEIQPIDPLALQAEKVGKVDQRVSQAKRELQGVDETLKDLKFDPPALKTLGSKKAKLQSTLDTEDGEPEDSEDSQNVFGIEASDEIADVVNSFMDTLTDPERSAFTSYAKKVVKALEGQDEKFAPVLKLANDFLSGEQNFTEEGMNNPAIQSFLQILKSIETSPAEKSVSDKFEKFILQTIGFDSKENSNNQPSKKPIEDDVPQNLIPGSPAAKRRVVALQKRKADLSKEQKSAASPIDATVFDAKLQKIDDEIKSLTPEPKTEGERLKLLMDEAINNFKMAETNSEKFVAAMQVVAVFLELVDQMFKFTLNNPLKKPESGKESGSPEEVARKSVREKLLREAGVANTEGSVSFEKFPDLVDNVRKKNKEEKEKNVETIAKLEESIPENEKKNEELIAQNKTDEAEVVKLRAEGKNNEATALSEKIKKTEAIINKSAQEIVEQKKNLEAWKEQNKQLEKEEAALNDIIDEQNKLQTAWDQIKKMVDESALKDKLPSFALKIGPKGAFISIDKPSEEVKKEFFEKIPSDAVDPYGNIILDKKGLEDVNKDIEKKRDANKK